MNVINVVNAGKFIAHNVQI